MTAMHKETARSPNANRPQQTGPEFPTPEHLTPDQDAALHILCELFRVPYNPDHYRPILQLPPEWVAGWVGGVAQQYDRPTVYIGCSPEGALCAGKVGV
jgi:hypothetical protein